MSEQQRVGNDAPDTISKVHNLQKRFYEVCGELFKYMEFVGEPMYNLMLEHYFTQYKREYDLMNAAEFIEVDKKIEELKIERDKELEAVKLARDTQKIELLIASDKAIEEIKLDREKQKKLLEMAREREIKEIDLERAKLSEELATIREKELEAVKLEHASLTAEIERKREKLNNEIYILWETVQREARIKAYRITPQLWRRFNIGRLHFGKVYKNEAMQYVEAAASIEAEEYLTEREQAIFQIVDGDNITQVPAKIAQKEYTRFLKRYEKALRTRTEAETESETPENEAEGQETDTAGKADEAETRAAGGKEMPEESGAPETADTSLIVENE